MSTGKAATIYLLWRTHGEHEEHREDVIGAFAALKDAEKLALRAEDWFKQRPDFDWDRMTDEEGRVKPYWKKRMTCPFDPGHYEATGSYAETPQYVVTEIDLVPAAPPAQERTEG